MGTSLSTPPRFLQNAGSKAALNNEVVRNLVQNEVVEAVKRDPKAAVEAAKELMDRVEEAGKAANK